MLPRFLPFFLFAFGLSAAAFADAVTIDGNSYQGTLSGIRDGGLFIRIKGADRHFDLDQVQRIAVDGVPALDAAEAAREADPLTAAQRYKQAIAAINDPEIKRLAEFRAVQPTDASGHWAESVQLFLDVYQAHPDAAVWQGRPTHMPAAGSKLLDESADAITAAIKTAASNNEERKNLQSWLLDIYARAGDTDAAARLATEMKTGIPADAPATSGSENTAPDFAARIAAIETQLQSRQFTAALQNADAMLDGTAQSPAAAGDAQVQLFSLKARALEGLNQPEDATAAWLRIPAHDPASPLIPAALLNAANLEKQLHHDAESAALVQELRSQYPTSPETLAIKP